MRQFAIAIIVLLVVVLNSCNNNADAPKEASKPTPLNKQELIKRGEYLVQITGCNDCHSPKKPGANGPELVPELALSGYSQDMPIPQGDKNVLSAGFAVFAPDFTSAAGPWGVSFSANLTPDSATGLGGWTEDQFKKAFTQGKYKGQDGGRMLLPPMPWPNYGKMADEDIKAVFAYLKNLKPVYNAVHPPIRPDKM